MNLSGKNRKDKRKAKRIMEQEELRKEEPETVKEAETIETDGETPDEVKEQSGDIPEEAEAETAETETAEAEAETDQDAQAEEGEEKPKKERKLKWARSGGSEKKPDPLQEKLSELNDRYARLFAEFDNFRKRSDKEKMQRYDFGVKDAVEKILPVIDNFERGLAAVPQEQSEDSFVTGMQMIYKQLMKALEDIGVTPIEAVGQEFNPDFHNAVMHVDDPEAGDNIIVEEFQKGYMYKDHVVRYSMVKVAN